MKGQFMPEWIPWVGTAAALLTAICFEVSRRERRDFDEYGPYENGED